MTDSTGSESPLEAAAGAAGPHLTEAFSLIANETRLAILLALWEAHEPFAGGTFDRESEAVSFSDLHEMIAIRDSGQFNYHLNKLEGRFVQSIDDGYQLTVPGRLLLQALIGGLGLQEVTMEQAELDMACPKCGAATAVQYEPDNRLYHVCTECEGYYTLEDNGPSGVISAGAFPPAGLIDRTPEEVFAVASRSQHFRTGMRIEGICPSCSGQVEASLHVCDQHEPAGGRCPTCGRNQRLAARFVCTVCKERGSSAPISVVRHHPAVATFYNEHEADIELGLNAPDFESQSRLFELAFEHEEELISTDPPRVRVTIRSGGEQLALTLNEDVDFVETSGPS